MGTSKNNLKTRKTELEDTSGLSKNNGKNVRYRIRKQEEKEAEQEVKDYEHESDKDQRVP